MVAVVPHLCNRCLVGAVSTSYSISRWGLRSFFGFFLALVLGPCSALVDGFAFFGKRGVTFGAISWERKGIRIELVYGELCWLLTKHFEMCNFHTFCDKTLIGTNLMTQISQIVRNVSMEQACLYPMVCTMVIQITEEIENPIYDIFITILMIKNDDQWNFQHFRLQFLYHKSGRWNF